MGKSGGSGKNYQSSDGTLLSKNSSDEDLARALNEGYANDPEFENVQITVKHHKVTLVGTVDSKDAKIRAQELAENTEGIRYVQNRLKVGDPHSRNSSSLLSTAH